MRVALVTVSDRCAKGEMQDATGPALRAALEQRGAQVVEATLVPDDLDLIRKALLRLADEIGVDVVFTNGGTGLGPRDVTPEATEAVLEKKAPGFAEAMRAAGLARTSNAMLSRGTAGLRRNTLIVNLPGSPRGAVESLEAVWPAIHHALEMIAGRGH